MQHSVSHAQILSIASELQKITRENNLDAIAGAISTQALDKLQSHRFHVMIAGEFANGKTTLINALLHANCLPVSSGANSSRIVEVVHGSEPSLTRIDNSGKRFNQDLGELTVLAQDRSSRDFYLEFAYPCELCRDGVVIIDTPGLQDVNKQRVAITFKYLPRTDMLIYVADATSGIKSTEYEFLGKISHELALPGMMVALNQIDKISGPEAIASVQRKTEMAIENIFDKRIPVFPISSIKALRACLSGNEEDLEASGLPVLENYLKNFLENDRFDAVVKATAAHLRIQCVAASNSINAVLQALTWDPSEHDRRTNAIMEDISAADQRIDLLKKEFLGKFKQVQTTFLEDLKDWIINNFRRSFLAKLTRANLSDLTAENVEEAIIQFAGDEVKNQCEATFREVGREFGTVLINADIKTSPLASISSNIVAVVLAAISYTFLGLFTWLAVLIVGNMVGAIDMIKDYQKEVALKNIGDSLRQALPGIVEKIEAEIVKECTQIEEKFMTNLSEARNVTLGSLSDAIERVTSERLKGQDELAVQKKLLSEALAKVNEFDQQLQSLV